MGRRGGSDVPRFVTHEEGDEPEAESSSADEAEEDEEAGVDAAEEEEEADAAGAARGKQKLRPERKQIKLTLTGAAKAAAVAAGGCKVCGSMAHAAGFVGSVYMDCPDRPCYLCKKPGHTTATCPFRVGASADVPASSSTSRRSLAVPFLLASLETAGVRLGRACAAPPAPYAPPTAWRAAAAVLKLHSRRVTALAFHPDPASSLLISGDKRGQIGIWNHADVAEKTVVESGVAHQWMVAALRFFPNDTDSVYTSSLDGTVARTSVETAAVSRVGNLNPGVVWCDDDNAQWRSALCMDVDATRTLLLVGDDVGGVHLLDPRAQREQGRFQAAKARTKLVTLAVNAADPSIFACAGNDHVARLWDVRRLSTASASEAAEQSAAAGNKALKLALASLAHPRVVSDVAFSPHTARKLLTTCTDNRLRVWDDVSRLTGNEAQPPKMEIVHSHDFNRHLSPFKAVWDPKDPSEATIVIGRYISEDFRGLALHPIDIFNSSTGRAVAQIVDPNVPTIQPVVACHRTRELIASGTSRNLIVYEPVPDEDEGDDALASAAAGAAAAAAAARFTFKPRMLDLNGKKGGKGGKGGGKGGFEDEDEDDDDMPMKKRKA